MHPGMMYWWKQRHGGGCGEGAHAEEGGHGHGRHHGWRGGYEASGGSGGDDGGSFGVRRPLRFLAYKLELNETQVGELAKGVIAARTIAAVWSRLHPLSREAAAFVEAARSASAGERLREPSIA